MDPVSLVVTAVALGASAGLNDTAAAVVKDSYAWLKQLLGRRQVDVAAVEKMPGSTAKQDSLREDLAELAGPDAVDDELVAAARSLVDAVTEQAPAAAEVVGVDLEHVRAEFLRIGEVTATGTGVLVRDGEFSGGIDIDRVQAGIPPQSSPGSAPPEPSGSSGPR